MSKLTTNKVFSFSQAIAAQIKEDCPQINISSNKLSTIIAKEVGSSPAELDLLLRLHNKYLESNCGPGLSPIGVFYNQEENEADIALLKVGKNKIEEIPNLQASEGQSLKSVLLRFMCFAVAILL